MQGVEAWNQWRKQHPEIQPDLSFICLRAARSVDDYLRSDGADLRGAYLRRADLSHSNLSSARLKGADLTETRLLDANLSHTDLREGCLSHASLSGTCPSGADLRRAKSIGYPFCLCRSQLNQRISREKSSWPIPCQTPYHSASPEWERVAFFAQHWPHSAT